jgi:hypothetical protein
MGDEVAAIDIIFILKFLTTQKVGKFIHKKMIIFKKKSLI